MKLYFAPMEGITGLVCRNAYEACFSGSIEKYFAPFITATTQKAISAKELKDILPQQNEGICLVPQILANRAEDFIKTAEAIVNLGYEEINLNLGCPSKTVVTKKKGAGFLQYPDLLDEFLYQVCDWTEKKQIRFSVKTRLGMYEEEEFWELLDLYNKYKLCELIVHPRTQMDYYIHPVHEEVFERVEALSTNPLCYNGDLYDEERLQKFAEGNPDRKVAMIGRGLLMHPGMRMYKREPAVARDDLWRFHDSVYEGYCKHIQGDKNMLFKMKELWSYLCESFDPEETVVKKSLKQIRKSQHKSDYESAVRQLKMVK